MAGFIIVCHRDDRGPSHSAADVLRCAQRIAPDNIEAHPPLLWDKGGVVSAVVNPGPGTHFCEGSIAVGHLYRPYEDWWQPEAPLPDGAYVLCRVDARRLELVTDLYASRTAWYVHTDEAFLASSSQRALVSLLGDLELNHEAVSWLMSSGYSCPGAGWDRRLRKLPPACRLTLDRDRWTIDETRHPIPIVPTDGAEGEHVDRLRIAINDSCARLGVPWQSWRLALSGGMDSRSILLGLVLAGEKPSCITWGLDAARLDPDNDAAIAERVAGRFDLPHSFYSTDFSGEPLDLVLGRFVAASEGRLDHFEAYTDGLNMWRQLFEAGVEGMVRGDEPSQGYHWHNPSEHTVRRRQAQMVQDYPPEHVIHRLTLAPQTWPDHLRKRADETPSAYSGRLFNEFLSPAMLSPLNDLKGLYMEIANPLLSRPVVAACHGLPESLRKGRRALEAVHEALKLDIPFTERSAPASRKAYFNHPGFRGELRRGLSLPASERVFTEEAVKTLETVLAEQPVTTTWTRIRPKVKAAVPTRLRERLKPLPQLTGSGIRLVFRAYIAVRMTELLTKDATLLRREGSCPGADG